MIENNKNKNKNKNMPPSDKGKGMREIRTLVPKLGMKPAQAPVPGLVPESEHFWLFLFLCQGRSLSVRTEVPYET